MSCKSFVLVLVGIAALTCMCVGVSRCQETGYPSQERVRKAELTLELEVRRLEIIDRAKAREQAYRAYHLCRTTFGDETQLSEKQQESMSGCGHHVQRYYE